jgi:hypothetical protein
MSYELTLANLIPFKQDSTLESAAWSLSLTTKEFQSNLHSRYPVSSPHQTTRDESSLGKIFGQLTWLGALQMRKPGKTVAELESQPVSPRRCVIYIDNNRRIILKSSYVHLVTYIIY